MNNHNTKYNNNKASITGIVTSIKFNHESYGEKFYSAFIESKRLNDLTDLVPIIISENIADTENLEGKIVRIIGEFHSFNNYEDGRSYLKLFVFANDVELLDKIPEETANHENNHVFLNGYVCKEPIYRTTPLGKEIADVIVAVNRQYGKSDYIPCVCWGDDAKLTSELNVGDKIVINGRIQSRYYVKKISETETEQRLAYEVSVYHIEKDNANDKESV